MKVQKSLQEKLAAAKARVEKLEKEYGESFAGSHEAAMLRDSLKQAKCDVGSWEWEIEEQELLKQG
jgi:hypothetical protein